jgi:hypothetical protein
VCVVCAGVCLCARVCVGILGKGFVVRRERKFSCRQVRKENFN